MIADNMKVPMELYRNTVPGLYAMGAAKNVLGQFLDFMTCLGSGSIPSDIVRTSLIVRADRLDEIESGRSFGKNEMTLSETFILFSLTANPIAVDVKVLLAEYKVCRSDGLYGSHHPSAITLPWRRIITLCNSFLLFSEALINFRMSADETPSASGVLRGREVPVCAAAENETTIDIKTLIIFIMRHLLIVNCQLSIVNSIILKPALALPLRLSLTLSPLKHISL